MSATTAIFWIVFLKLIVTTALFVGTGYAVIFHGFSGWWFALAILLAICLPGVERKDD